MHHYQTAIVLGLAASGEAATRLLLAEGTKVAVVDRGDSAMLRQRAKPLQDLGATINLGAARLPDGDFAIAIVSPGIPADSETVKAVTVRGIPVISELELGWSRAACRVLAVTGSNGKSTLTKLCAEALAIAGCRVAIAGNYGPPVSAVASQSRDLDWLVLEVSSFQLEAVRSFRPDVGVLLNVMPNHLDRHGDFPAYLRLKARLFAKMTPADTGITDSSILPVIKELSGARNRWLAVGNDAASDFFYRPGAIDNKFGWEQIDLHGTLFDNEIMGLTAAAAAAALSACGVKMDYLAAAMRAFRPLPHRLQVVATVREVRFVDDSKATNLAALMAALRMTPRPVRLIAGGLPKNESFEPARRLLSEKVVAIYLIGQAADAMAGAWRGAAPCIRSETLFRAVADAWHQAVPGDTILLSPGCASFDQFRNFEERGACFEQAIQSLPDWKE